jgi:hypothetical protein
MNNEHEIETIRVMFEHLKTMLEENHGSNHLVGVQSAIHVLSNLEVLPSERIRITKSILKSMMGGMGTLGDFVIWDENEERRSSLNHELNELLAGLWNRLEC